MRLPLSLVVATLLFVACDSTATTPLDSSSPSTEILPNPSDGACTYQNRTFDDDVTIAENESCTFTNVTVEGNVQLERNAVLTATGLTVDGNIQAQEAQALTVESSQVQGNQVQGNIQFEQGGDIDVRTTEIDGNLQCKENNPAPGGGNNTVGGNKEDQCGIL